jgi:hypothetical protein
MEYLEFNDLLFQYLMYRRDNIPNDKTKSSQIVYEHIEYLIKGRNSSLANNFETPIDKANKEAKKMFKVSMIIIIIAIIVPVIAIYVFLNKSIVMKKIGYLMKIIIINVMMKNIDRIGNEEL